MLVLKIGANSYYQGSAVPALFRSPDAPAGPAVVTTPDKSAAAHFEQETAAAFADQLRKDHPQLEVAVEPA
jgi:hypothetical protein